MTMVSSRDDLDLVFFTAEVTWTMTWTSRTVRVGCWWTSDILRTSRTSSWRRSSLMSWNPTRYSSVLFIPVPSRVIGSFDLLTLYENNTVWFHSHWVHNDRFSRHRSEWVFYPFYWASLSLRAQWELTLTLHLIHLANFLNHNKNWLWQKVLARLSTIVALECAQAAFCSEFNSPPQTRLTKQMKQTEILSQYRVVVHRRGENTFLVLISGEFIFCL